MTRYARNRMRTRGVTRDQVVHAIHHPNRTRKAKIPGAMLFEKQISTRRRLVVIADERSDPIRIINTYWHTVPKGKKRE